ncbi:MAG: DUF4139 domain-containing protein [Bacteroidota bacterium]|nr:DUF4139 domain-containing protein [Bacteroidota bacterium]MDP3145935.1 DUF4139 domain-containing protein [Bacteroidota bacterium]MDP3558570.1 DUF4139 domain-containing protein [Bacteroidota bacterium]
MKYIFYLLIIPFFGFSQAQNQEQRIETPVKAVTLYLDGAEVNQQKSVNLNPGITSIVFTNLSPKLIPKSIQVNVGAGVSVLSVSEKLNFLSLNAESLKIKQLRDSLKENKYKTQQLVYDKEAYDKEKELLAKNNSIGGQDKGVAISELKLAADFYRSRIKEINTEILKLDTKINESYVLNNRIQGELNELNAQENKPTGEIIILLQCDTKFATNIDLKYVVSDAGWAPYYELKAEDIGKPITLVYRARAFNNTGINWSDVKLKLSTSDPTRNASKPAIAPWFLNFNMDVYNNNNVSGYSKNAPAMAYQQSQINSDNLENQYGSRIQLSEKEQKSFNDYKSKGKREEANKVIYEEVQVSELSAEFEIKKAYTIPSDAKPYIVEVTTYSLDATFKHFSIPKVEKDAFLLARITGWEDLDLIEGPANVYFGGTFVGQSYVNPRSVNDTLDLSFGRDSKVIVTRTKIKDFNRDRTMGSSRKIVYSYEMIIKNNRKTAVNIDLEDQLPISQNSEIFVDAIELSKGMVNKDDGKVSWKFLIPPGESQKVIYTYSIKYPKNRNVDTERTLKKARAKF